MINSGEFEEARLLLILPKDTTLFKDNNNGSSKEQGKQGKQGKQVNIQRRFDFKRMKDVIMKIIDINLGVSFIYLVSYSVYPALVYDLPFL